MIGIFIALLSGALMSVQGVFNTQVTKGTSMWVSNSWVQFSAFVICIVAWFFSDRKSFGSILQVEPKYMHIYCHKEYGSTGAGPGSHADCGGSASAGLSD